MYSLSAKIFLKSLCVKSLSFNGSRSSTFQGVSVHCIFLSTAVYHYMLLESVEPSHRTLALGSSFPHRPVAVCTLHVA